MRNAAKPSLVVALPLAFAGGAIGTSLRVAAHWLGDALHVGPWISTLCVNVVASFIAGFLGRLLLGHLTRQQALAAEVVDPYEAQAHRNAMLLITGFCGGLSTFSALGLELHDLIQSRHVLESTIAAALSVVIGLLAAWSGLSLGMRLNRHR
jgi:CrcB protein